MSVDPHDRTLRILREIHTGQALTQRSLAQSLGIALGLTNSLVRRLVRKGYVRVTGVPPTRIRYFLTPRGMAELTRRAADSMDNTLHLYTATRDRIREQLTALQALAVGENGTRVIFYGAGEVAEIAYITLAGSRLKLVGVIDDVKVGERFFDFEIQAPDALVDGTAPEHDVIVVTTFKKRGDISNRLDALRVPPSRVFQLAGTVIECLPDLTPR